MAGAKIVIDHDFEDATRMLNELLSFGQEPYEFLDGVGQIMEESTQQNFDDESAPDGTSWKPSQRAVATGGRTLNKRGMNGLFGSITSNATDSEVEWGSDYVYAAIHQFGGETGARGKRFNMPARPFLGMTAQDEKSIEDLFAEFTREVVQ